MNILASSNTYALLGTAIVKVRSQESSIYVAALCDSGSQLNLISESLVNKLKLNRTFSNHAITGIGQKKTQSKGTVKLTVVARGNNGTFEIDALIVPRVVNRLPTQFFSTKPYKHLIDIELADSKFNEPKHIDLLFGSNVWASILRNGIKRSSPSEPIAVNTSLGWVVFGPIVNNNGPKPLVLHVQDEHESDDLHQLLTKFWEVEQLPERKFRSTEEQFCEDHFMDTHTRTENGRYVVQMPIKTDAPQLGTSRRIAMIWLRRIEKSLENKPIERRLYNEFMQKYIDLGHMKMVDPPNSEDNMYYIPHHCVYKHKKNEAKFRTVFHASSASSNGISLNQIQSKGEKL